MSGSGSSVSCFEILEENDNANNTDGGGAGDNAGAGASDMLSQQISTALVSAPPAVPVPNGRTRTGVKSSSSSRRSRPPASSDIKLFFSQFYGKPFDAEVMDAEVISALEFNHTGDLLAVGDRGGRVTIYNRQRSSEEGTKLRILSNNSRRPASNDVNYKPYFSFQSHEMEFYHSKRIDIEAKITQVKWVPRETSSGQLLLASNDKTIKLWRIGRKYPWSCSTTDSIRDYDRNIINSNSNILRFPVPSMAYLGSGFLPSLNASLRRSFENAHTYNINRLSLNSDQETFISSDDLRINLWNLEVTDQCFVVVDIKPENMENLHEKITCSSFHPSKCNLLSYSTSRGITKLCDMRTSALCDRPAKLFHDPNSIGPRGGQHIPCGEISEIVTCVSDARFSHSGRYLATRDFLNLTIWDLHMESRPLSIIPIHEYLQPHLFTLYETDNIFDKFSLSWNGSDSRLVSGSYSNFFSVVDRMSGRSSLLEAPKEIPNSVSGSKAPLLKQKRVVDFPTTSSSSTTSSNRAASPPEASVASSVGGGGASKKSKTKNSVGGSGNTAVAGCGAVLTKRKRCGTKDKKLVEEVIIDDVDFSKKTLITEWHPSQNVLALASHNNLYFFQDMRLLYN